MILHMHNIWLLEKSIRMLQLELSILMLILTHVLMSHLHLALCSEILDNDENVDYLVLGLAQGGNTRALYDYAKDNNIIYVYADELLHQVSPTIKDKIERFIHDHDTIMFTICMDVIDSAFAPGVSSPSVLGLYPHSVFEISKRVILSDKVSSISIAETNPDYDVDNRTSKLAANLIHHFLV